MAVDKPYSIRARQRGAALVVVLWLIVVLTIVAAGHRYNAHIESQLAARHLETTRSRYLAEAATQLTIAQLLTPDTAQRLAVDGRLSEIEIDEQHSAIVSVRRTDGLVDLNSADQRLLQSVFIAGGASERLAAALAARVLDWRDPDSFRRIDGAEDTDYRNAGLQWTPRDAQFAAVDELRYILDMPPAVYDAVSPWLTVHSASGGLDLNVAPTFLSAALDARQNANSPAVIDGELPPNLRGGDGIYRIDVAVQAPGGVFLSSETIVRIARNARSPFSVLGWRDHSRMLTRQRKDEEI